MRDELKREMQAAIIEVVLPDASVVAVNESVYGWKDEYANSHIKGRPSYWRPNDDTPCVLVGTDDSTITEEEVSEFDGTFSENLDWVAIDITNVNCACGYLKNRKVRSKTSVGELLPKLFES